MSSFFLSPPAVRFFGACKYPSLLRVGLPLEAFHCVLNGSPNVCGLHIGGASDFGPDFAVPTVVSGDLFSRYNCGTVASNMPQAIGGFPGKDENIFVCRAAMPFKGPSFLMGFDSGGGGDALMWCILLCVLAMEDFENSFWNYQHTLPRPRKICSFA